MFYLISKIQDICKTRSSNSTETDVPVGDTNVLWNEILLHIICAFWKKKLYERNAAAVVATKKFHSSDIATANQFQFNI